MARILVAGPPGLAARPAVTALLERLQADGHDGDRLDAPSSEAVQEADALIALLDPLTPQATAAVAAAHALHKPVLGLAGDEPLPDWVEASCDQTVAADSLQAAMTRLPAFYDHVRPFAGRLVRDLVPKLVREAGYDVTFRAVEADERPRFLKQKVLDEARQLLAAEAGAEKEEVADLLEALETLIRVREYGRDALKQVKDAKHKRRGGFERGWVVESTAGTASPPGPSAPEDGAAAAEDDEAPVPAEEPPGDPDEPPASARQASFFEA